MPRRLKPYSHRIVAQKFNFYRAVLDFPGVYLPEAAVFSLLASLQQGRPCSSPSQEYMATYLKLSPSSVKRAIKTLESLHLVSVARFRTPDGRKHNSYTVNAQLALDIQDARPAIRKAQIASLRNKYNQDPPPKA